MECEVEEPFESNGLPFPLLSPDERPIFQPHCPLAKKTSSARPGPATRSWHLTQDAIRHIWGAPLSSSAPSIHPFLPPSKVSGCNRSGGRTRSTAEKREISYKMNPNVYKQSWRPSSPAAEQRNRVPKQMELDEVGGFRQLLFRVNTSSGPRGPYGTKIAAV